MGKSSGSSASFCLKTGWRCGKNRLPCAMPCWTPCSTIKLPCAMQGWGIGKTYAYLTACILLKKFYPSGPAGSQPVVVSTSSVALQDAIIGEYIPFLSRIFLENHIIPKPIRAMVRKGEGTVRLRCPPCPAAGGRQGKNKTRYSAKRCSPFKAIMTWTLSLA